MNREYSIAFGVRRPIAAFLSHRFSFVHHPFLLAAFAVLHRQKRQKRRQVGALQRVTRSNRAEVANRAAGVFEV